MWSRSCLPAHAVYPHKRSELQVAPTSQSHCAKPGIHPRLVRCPVLPRPPPQELIDKCNNAGPEDLPPATWHVPYKSYFCFAHTFGGDQLMDVWIMRRVGSCLGDRKQVKDF